MGLGQQERLSNGPERENPMDIRREEEMVPIGRAAIKLSSVANTGLYSKKLARWLWVRWMANEMLMNVVMMMKYRVESNSTKVEMVGECEPLM